MQQRRPNDTDDVSPKQVAVHFAMGALLGTFGSLFLVFSNASAIHRLFWAAAESPGFMALFVLMCASTIAIGSSLTGVIFSAIEAERIAASRRRPPHDRT